MLAILEKVKSHSKSFLPLSGIRILVSGGKKGLELYIFQPCFQERQRSPPHYVG